MLLPSIGFTTPLPPVGRTCRRGHWSTEGLRSLVIPNTGTRSVDVYDFARGLWLSGSGLSNNVPTVNGLANFTHVNDGLILASDSTELVPTNRVTVLVVRRKTDTTARASQAFAVLSANTAHWCQAAIPWSDSKAYWELGGGSGANQLPSPSTIPITTDGEAWAFVAGSRGMAMYRNGTLIASTSTAVTRTATTDRFYLNNGGGGSNSRGDFAEYSFFALLDAEWSDEQVKAWTADQGIMFWGMPLAWFGQAEPPVENEFTIDGVEREILQNWRISENLNERNTMRFGVKSMDASYRPAQRDAINFIDQTVLLFSGIIFQKSETGLGGYGVVPIVTSCQATDYNVLPSYRQAAVTIPDGSTVKEALEIVQTYLDDYGVTLDPSQADGDPLDELVFELGPIRSVLNKLSLITGWVWEITYTKLLRMYPPGDTAAPFNIEDNDARVIGDVSVSPTTADYANRVYVLAGSGTKDVEDHFVGDGVEDTFPLTYNPASFYGYVTVNAVVETLGPGATWEYNEGTNSITRTAGAPGNLDPIVITYVGSFPYVAMAEDVPAQDGGANLVEKTYTAPDVMDATTAQAMAVGYLAQSLSEPREIRYTTKVPGLHPGMSQHIECTGRDLDSDCLITNVDTYPVGTRGVLRYDVTAIEGFVIVPGFQQKWREMTGGVGNRS